MIASLTGHISLFADRSIVLTVGGVGYKIFLSADTLKQARATGQDQEISFFTHLAVREDALDLYGFLDKNELEFFTMLISISGIGPKSALGILSIAPPDLLRKAVQAEDPTYLTKVSGIGRKSADKIILELKDRLGKIDSEAGASLKEESETVEALLSLGYTLKDAREAMRRVPASITDTKDKIREALKFLK